MAFIKSSLPTISTRNDCRPGMSNAFTTPSSAASTKISHTRWSMACVRVSAASTNASSIDAICVPITTCLRLVRSATIPPIGATRNTGIWLAESHRAQLQSRPRQPVDQPGLRHGLHPGADQRNQLSAEKQLEVAMPQRASGRPASADGVSSPVSTASAIARSGMGIFDSATFTS